MPEERRERLINGRLAQAREVFEFVNTVGIGTVLAIGVVALAASWLFGWTPTPWVTPTEFRDFRKDYTTVHDQQNLLHKEQTTEMKKQTKILKLNRCDVLETRSERRVCYREVNEE